MELTVFNGEYHERSKYRYGIFAIVIIIIIALSIRKQNIIGGILLLFIVGAYIYYNVISLQTTRLRIQKNHLSIGEKNIPRHQYTGFVLEGDHKTREPKNIVLISKDSHTIYSLNDTTEHIETFIETLNTHIPMGESYKQTGLDKRSRFLKL